MLAKSRSTRKKNTPSQYLELHIDENGKVNFYNLSKNTLTVIEKISGKNQDHQSFYCG
jgi:hypothetical protein